MGDAAASEGGRGMTSTPETGPESAAIYGDSSYIVRARELCAA
jgi:hypothetical protein